MYPAPVTTVYERPLERVLISPLRDANPFLHLFEAAWMLGGREDVASVATYASQMRKYSDDGKRLHGAYGKRWRGWFLLQDGKDAAILDQLTWAIDRLKTDPNDRRVVIGMWDAAIDPCVASLGGKDVPCNTHCYVSVGGDGRVNLTICCRSNDMIWGAYGANAVHFSYLLEYIACALGRPVGTMTQVSNNYHAYVEVLDKIRELPPTQPYGKDEYGPSSYPLFTNSEHFDQDLAMLLDERVSLGLRTPWLRKVLVPVIRAHEAYRLKGDPQRFEKALEIIEQCKAPDWRVACREWLQRRQAKAERAKDDGVQHDD
jgi:hypothetical protein